MKQLENTTVSRKGKHLNFAERFKIEAWSSQDEPLSNNRIAKLLGRACQTIHTELRMARFVKFVTKSNEAKSTSMAILFTLHKPGRWPMKKRDFIQ